MSFRGNGLECPVPPGDDADDNAGEFLGVVFRELLRLDVFLSCSLSVSLSSPTTGDVVPDMALVALALRVMRRTPLAIDELTGTTIGAASPELAAGAEDDNREEFIGGGGGGTIPGPECFAAFSKLARKLSCCLA